MAHKKCPTGKVWPPTFRPTLDPNEVLKQINALCAHLGKLGYLASGLPLPQRLPAQAVARPAPQSSPRRVAPRRVHVEEKKTAETPATRRDSDEDSSPQPSPSPSDSEDDRPLGTLKKAQATPKRKQRPPKTPLTTPSPNAKDPRNTDADPEKQKAGVPKPATTTTICFQGHRFTTTIHHTKDEKELEQQARVYFTCDKPI